MKLRGGELLEEALKESGGDQAANGDGRRGKRRGEGSGEESQGLGGEAAPEEGFGLDFAESPGAEGVGWGAKEDAAGGLRKGGVEIAMLQGEAGMRAGGRWRRASGAAAGRENNRGRGAAEKQKDQG